LAFSSLGSSRIIFLDPKTNAASERLDHAEERKPKAEKNVRRPQLFELYQRRLLSPVLANAPSMKNCEATTQID
jgi:hypothetical protein